MDPRYDDPETVTPGTNPTQITGAYQRLIGQLDAPNVKDAF
jgi:hypothetical protein